MVWYLGIWSLIRWRRYCWWKEIRRGLTTWDVSGQISSRPHTTDFPQMVVNCKGNPLISGKPRLVKYYNLARMYETLWIMGQTTNLIWCRIDGAINSTYPRGPILAHLSRQWMMVWGVQSITSEMQGTVFRFHETILRFGEPGSLGLLLG